MLSSLSNISQWGVTPEMSPAFAKRIILTNRLGLLFTINMSASGLAFLLFREYGLALFTFFFVATEFCWPVLNYYRRYNFSRIGLLISSNLLGFFVSVMLQETGYNRGFYVMCGVPILIFSIKEKKSILLGILLPLILYPLSEVAQYHFPLALNLTPAARDFIFYTIGMVYVVLIFLMFLFLAVENARAEQKLSEALHRVEEQRLRSFSSAKFAALGEMAAGIAHEINNPMTVIHLNTEHIKFLMNAEAVDRKQAIQKLDLITRTVHRIARIIDSMRAFSRQADQDPFSNEVIQKIIDETMVFCSERFKAHQVQLTIKLPPEDIYLRCRPVQMSQVLLNLLNNSFDAVEELNEKWIKLEVEHNHHQVCVSITDSGKGIPVSLQEKIFHPFYTTKPPGKGTGLGLSLSRTIIEDHNGNLYLDTSSSNTRFVFHLNRSENV